MRHERELRLAGFERIAGIDEVGRGSLAGPVVAAAVIMAAGEALLTLVAYIPSIDPAREQSNWFHALVASMSFLPFAVTPVLLAVAARRTRMSREGPEKPAPNPMRPMKATRE